jgi:hypothetical protein
VERVCLGWVLQPMESIRSLVDSSFFIAWTYLEETGELGQADTSAVILLDAIEAQIKRGERRPLMLANKAIAAHREHAMHCGVLSAVRGIAMDNLTKRDQRDRSKINMHEDFEVKYWTRELGVTREQLQKAVDKVGNSAATVRKELGK